MAFLYLGCWFLMAGVVYYFFGLETKGKSIAQIDKELADRLMPHHRSKGLSWIH